MGRGWCGTTFLIIPHECPSQWPVVLDLALNGTYLSVSGLGIAITLLGPKQDKPGSIFRVVAQIIISLLLVFIIDRLKPSQDNMLLFYILAFFKHSFTIVLLTVGVPTIFGLFSKTKV